MIRRDVWNTYHVAGYTHDLTQDQASAGGIILSQVRRTKRGWQRRACQSNGRHRSYTPAEDISEAEGLRLWAEAQRY